MLEGDGNVAASAMLQDVELSSNPVSRFLPLLKNYK